MKTIRLTLPPLVETEEILDLVTQTEGVVGALVGADGSTIDVMVSGAASALLVREQLLAYSMAAA